LPACCPPAVLFQSSEKMRETLLMQEGLYESPFRD